MASIEQLYYVQAASKNKTKKQIIEDLWRGHTQRGYMNWNSDAKAIKVCICIYVDKPRLSTSVLVQLTKFLPCRFDKNVAPPDHYST
jgi:hypothetical protein